MENIKFQENEFNKNKWINFIFFHLLLIFLVILIGTGLHLGNKDYEIQNYDLLIFCWIGNLVIVYCLVSWWKLTNTFFHPYVMFLLALYIFTYGQAFLKSFGMSYEKYDLYELFNEGELLKAQIFTCIAISFIHLGALLSLKKKVNFIPNMNEEIKEPALKMAVRGVAWILVLCTLYFYFYQQINNAIITTVYGYGSLYGNAIESSSVQNITNSLRMFFIPGIYLLFIAYKNNWYIRKMVIIIIVCSVALSFIGGSRTEGIAIIMSFSWLYHIHINRFNFKKLIPVMAIGLFILTLVPTFSQFRDIANKDLSSFLILYGTSLQDNPIKASIGELGGSMFPLIQVMKIQPDFSPFMWGESYVNAITSMIPAILTGGEPIVPRISLANWLMDILGMNYGPGFSLIAEAYYNFGWLGSIFLIIIGYSFGKLFNLNSINKDKQILFNVLIASSLYYSMFAVRDQLMLFIRYEVYGILIVYIVVMMFRAIVKKERLI
ncbi:O-antigen polysaccharide polymerase Wzy [Bacillus cereus]|uniref:O-antigen polysaccharide polymerase Wzy n=1 Tax=Bacillus cereus TaxID=1396 RepID=UPI00381DE75B